MKIVYCPWYEASTVLQDVLNASFDILCLQWWECRSGSLFCYHPDLVPVVRDLVHALGRRLVLCYTDVETGEVPTSFPLLSVVRDLRLDGLDIDLEHSDLSFLHTYPPGSYSLCTYASDWHYPGPSAWTDFSPSYYVCMDYDGLRPTGPSTAEVLYATYADSYTGGPAAIWTLQRYCS
jgi:hypothetical protein